MKRKEKKRKEKKRKEKKRKEKKRKEKKRKEKKKSFCRCLKPEGKIKWAARELERHQCFVLFFVLLFILFCFVDIFVSFFVDLLENVASRKYLVMLYICQNVNN